MKNTNDELTKLQASMIVALATSRDEWLTKSEIQERTEGQPSLPTVQRCLKKMIGLGVVDEEKTDGQGRGRENYYRLVQSTPLKDGRIRQSIRSKQANARNRKGKDLDDEGSMDVREVLNQEFVECPKCHAVLWRKEGVEHCGHVYHNDPDLWERLPNLEKVEGEEEGGEEEGGASLLVDCSGLFSDKEEKEVVEAD